MKLLCQRDPKWSALKLGSSACTLGRYGCTTTAISMLSDYFGSYIDPGQLATKVLKYTYDGLILWTSVDAIPDMKFEKRVYGQNDAEILKSLKDPAKAVILEVEGRHWVVALSKIPFMNLYRISDPFFGNKGLSSRYKIITGSAHFIQK